MIVFITNSINLQGQDCIKCDPNSDNSGDFATALGQSTTASGLASFASGKSTKAIGDYSFVFGYYAEANKIFSVAIGYKAIADNEHSVAIGRNLLSSAPSSFALGRFLESKASASFVIGSGYDNENRMMNGKPLTMMIGFKSTAPTLFISKSLSSLSHKDRTGRVAIGNMTEPQAKLHIYADDNESATLFLQPSNWNQQNDAAIWLGDTSHGISAEKDEGLVYQTRENHIFKGGNVYIEDIDKGIIMKSPDGRCWLGTLDNNGSLNFTVMETCPGAPDAVHETRGSGPDNGLKVYPNPTNGYLTIEIENPGHKLLSVSLLDEKGHEVLIKQIHTGKTQIYTGDLKTGIYFVRVTGNGKKMVEKVVRQ